MKLLILLLSFTLYSQSRAQDTLFDQETKEWFMQELGEKDSQQFFQVAKIAKACQWDDYKACLEELFTLVSREGVQWNQGNYEKGNDSHSYLIPELESQEISKITFFKNLFDKKGITIYRRSKSQIDQESMGFIFNDHELDSLTLTRYYPYPLDMVLRKIRYTPRLGVGPYSHFINPRPRKNCTRHDLKIAIIDNGFDYNHPELSPFIHYCQGFFLGYDFLNEDPFPYTDSPPLDFSQLFQKDHGTQVAGVATKGIKDINLILFKSWSIKKQGDEFYFSNAMEKAAEFGAKFVNISQVINFSTQVDIKLERERMIEVLKKYPDVLFVVAAGNTHGEVTEMELPASIQAPNLISVAWTKNNGSLLEDSRYSKKYVHLGAPGNRVKTIVNRNKLSKEKVSGSSFSSPFVVNALVRFAQTCGTTDNEELKTYLKQAITPTRELKNKTRRGSYLSEKGVTRVLKSCKKEKAD